MSRAWLSTDATNLSRDSVHDALTYGLEHVTVDHDPDQPAQVGAAEQLGRDGPLQRGDEAVFNAPPGDQAHEERRDPSPVDVAIGAALRVPIELVDVDVALPLDEEVGQDHAGPGADPQEQADHPVVEGLGEG